MSWRARGHSNNLKPTRRRVRLMGKRVCWLLIEVARPDAESLQPLEYPAVGLATISLRFIIPCAALKG